MSGNLQCVVACLCSKFTCLLVLSSFFLSRELAGNGSLFVSESSLTTESNLPFAGKVYKVRERPHHEYRLYNHGADQVLLA